MSERAKGFWRRAAPHVIGLALLEWAVSFALARNVVNAIAAPLASHPAGADALFAEDGRIALELYFARSAELPPALAVAALTVGLVALVTVPLQGALPSLARQLPRSPWAQSIAHTPGIVALALAQATLFALLVLALRRPFTALAVSALASERPRDIASLTAVTVAALVVIAALRSLFALARGAVVVGTDARTALAHGFNALRARPSRIVLARLGVDFVALSVAALAAIAPASLAVIAAITAHIGRAAIELAWLRQSLDGLPKPPTTD
ncbi:MAG: hypothetical protein JNK05_26275 [Myxococcales bacterium]|nr:hypothetical protein [Myxococcales bacterium]